MDYTDLLELADSVGPAFEAGQRLANQDDLDQSGLLCCQAASLKDLPQLPTSETAEKCLSESQQLLSNLSKLS